jgi:hypothetical protein
MENKKRAGAGAQATVGQRQALLKLDGSMNVAAHLDLVSLHFQMMD